MAKVFVSVLIDTYNHERFIEEAVSSVLAQNFPAADREILVVDDGSTDRTPEILRRFGSEIRVLRKGNGGQASAFNVGIPECRGEIIAFLDGDDWWAQGKLRRVAGLMAGDPTLGMVGHAIIESFNDASERIIAPDAEKRFRLDSLSSAEFFRLHRCYLGSSRLTLRSSVARKILPVPQSLTIEADEYLFTLAAALTDSVILTEPLTHYRIHGANLFMAPSAFAGGERRKERAISALAFELHRALPSAGAPPDATASVLELIDAEAAQLRLQHDGGMPWETYRAERALYRIQHQGAPWESRAFHAFAMIPALLLPPRWFYAGRRWLGSQSWYKRARRDFLPPPQMTKTNPLPSIRSTRGGG
jgi:Glycosyl transferase family 2